MTPAQQKVDHLAKNYTSPGYTLEMIVADYRSPDAPAFWPFTCKAYADYCEEHGLSPLAPASVHDFFVLHTGPICEKCGEDDPVLNWSADPDPFGTGDSPDSREFEGTNCCGAQLVDSTGHVFDPIKEGL